MNNLSNSQLPILNENQEFFSFKTIKWEFISIIDWLLKTYENQHILEINILIDWFISEYQEYFNILLFGDIFGPHFLSDENPNTTKKIRNYISHKIARQKDDNRTKYMHDTISSYNIQNESAKCKWEIDKLLSYDENLLWYVIFKIFWQKIGDIENLNSLLSWVEILQKTWVFTDTITKVEIDDFLFKHREQLNIKMYLWLISSDRWGEVVQEIISTPEITTRKMDAIIFIMEYYKDKYKTYIPKLFKVYISWMKNKIKTSNSFRWIDNLRKIYKYYKENKATINPELDVEGAFENYSGLFKTEDFRGDLDKLHCWDLPVSYIKMAFSWFVKDILDIQDTIDVEVWLSDGWAINVLLSNVDHWFPEQIELSNDEIGNLQEIGENLQDGLRDSDYIKRYTSLIRKILYSELNQRIYWDNEKIREWLTKNYITAKKELYSIMWELLWYPEEKEFDFSNNNSWRDIEPNTKEEEWYEVWKIDWWNEIPF